jgi:chitinase
VLTIDTSSEYVIGAQSAATVIIFDEDNARPSVTLTNPIAGASFNAGANIALGATASDSDGLISKVEFYYDATNKIGEVTAPPYTFTWSNAPSGPRVLTAVAT